MANTNHIVVLTHYETPQVFLVQKYSEVSIREAVSMDPYLAEKRVNVFSFKPCADGAENKFGGIPLTPVHLPVQNPFEHHLQTALYYARINGHCDEGIELKRAAVKILARLKEIESNVKTQEAAYAARQAPTGGQAPTSEEGPSPSVPEVR